MSWKFFRKKERKKLYLKGRKQSVTDEGKNMKKERRKETSR